MNYDGMQADIVEMFVEAGRRRHTHVKGLFESRDVDGGGYRWRRDADTGRLWRPASGQERAEQGKAFRALLRAGGGHAREVPTLRRHRGAPGGPLGGATRARHRRALPESSGGGRIG